LLKVPSWTCTNDTFTRSVFKHGVCFFGDADGGTTTDAGADARRDASVDTASEPPVTVDAADETSNPADGAPDAVSPDAEGDAAAADGATDREPRESRAEKETRDGHRPSRVFGSRLAGAPIAPRRARCVGRRGEISACRIRAFCLCAAPKCTPRARACADRRRRALCRAPGARCTS
jgi:hypothetical protein